LYQALVKIQVAFGRHTDEGNIILVKKINRLGRDTADMINWGGANIYVAWQQKLLNAARGYEDLVEFVFGLYIGTKDAVISILLKI